MTLYTYENGQGQAAISIKSIAALIPSSRKDYKGKGYETTYTLEFYLIGVQNKLVMEFENKERRDAVLELITKGMQGA